MFALLRSVGQLDLFISLLYVALLGTVGGLMLVESVNAHARARAAARPPTLKQPGQHNWIHRLPLKMRFRASKLFVSVIPVLGIGAAIGFLASIMGVGGGFIMVPALIYLLKVPTNVVVGTSLFQIIVHRRLHDDRPRHDQPDGRHRAGVPADGRRRGRRAIWRAGPARSCAASSCARCWRCWCWRWRCGSAFDLFVRAGQASTR